MATETDEQSIHTATTLRTSNVSPSKMAESNSKTADKDDKDLLLFGVCIRKEQIDFIHQMICYMGFEKEQIPDVLMEIARAPMNHHELDAVVVSRTTVKRRSRKQKR